MRPSASLRSGVARVYRSGKSKNGIGSKIKRNKGLRFQRYDPGNGPESVRITNNHGPPTREESIRADVVDRLAKMKIRPQVDPESKTVRTPVGDLPISPLMDPSYLEAKRRHMAPKPKPDFAKHGKQERRLLRNPYALALATPVRFDPIPRVYLPRYFLQAFSRVQNPSTGEPWLVPHNLLPGPTSVAADCSVVECEEEEEEEEGNWDEDPMEQAADNGSISSPDKEVVSPATRGDDSDSAVDDSPAVSSSTLAPVAATARVATEATPQNQKPPQKPPRSQGATVHVIARNDIMTKLNAGLWAKATGFAKMSGTVVRKDMHSFVLELMRRKAVDRLSYYAMLCDDAEAGGSDRKYILPCARWEDLETLSHRGCALWFGSDESSGTGDGAGAGAESSAGRPPGWVQFPTTELPGVEGVRRGGAVAVYDMATLLGEEQVKDLRERAPLFRKASLFMLGRERTLHAQLLLWKIQGYLTEPK